MAIPPRQGGVIHYSTTKCADRGNLREAQLRPDRGIVKESDMNDS
jgi:hypothetical protein